MTLLTEVYRRPLDPGYAEAAARRATGTASPRTIRSLSTLVVIAVVLGLGTTAATIALRHPASSVQKAREILEGQIGERTEKAENLQAQIDELTGQVSSLQAEVLGDDDRALQEGADAVAVESGVQPVEGRGLRIELTDAPTEDPDTEDPKLRVQDQDLQVLVNGLWASGAEAIAVNGQRLTSMTAIRSAGDAVLVDLVPLSSPYKVDAIGNPVAMQPALARSSAGQRLSTLRTSFGIGVQMSSQSRLKLPGTGPVTLHDATRLGLGEATEPTPSTTPSPTQSGTADAFGAGRAPDESGVASSARLSGREGT
ncbi:DUF881 domain-containing protein [Cellulomonas sp. URHD0024]|uniref:DUF881 domain-containing protein n=1 Tax=Cellulomonas sp. URHD0024 TaxID=1302620 RepID=UPI00040F0DDA|nr:DUF881 domain-containing protein [Cellulomonas sp. URHD0024]